MKVLLVEDSRVLRERLRAIIGAIPHLELVGEADNETDAQRYLEQSRPDAVVLDLKLKGSSGLSVLEHIKAVVPQTIVLVLTNYGQPEYRSRCAELGADYFFDKSLNFDEFSACLHGLANSMPSNFGRPDSRVAQ